MVDNSIHTTSAHLKGICREAICLVNQGWQVLANYVPGFNQPPKIGEFIPDIYALKENQTYILMIVSQDDFDSDRTASFQEYAGEYNNTLFETCHVNAAGCRIRIY